MYILFTISSVSDALLIAAPLSLRGLGSYEWHPFSVSSAPDDEFVTLHIKAVGDWTNKLMALVKKTYEGRPRLSQVGVINHHVYRGSVFQVLDNTHIQFHVTHYAKITCTIVQLGPHGQL